MSEILVQHRGKFNFFNTITFRFRFDAALTKEEVADVVVADEGTEGLPKLQARIKASANQSRLNDMLFCNRAGENGNRLSFDECVEYFLS